MEISAFSVGICLVKCLTQNVSATVRDIESIDHWLHVIPKGQGYCPKIIEASYLDNHRWLVPIGNHVSRVKWSRDWWRHVTHIVTIKAGSLLASTVTVKMLTNKG